MQHQDFNHFENPSFKPIGLSQKILLAGLSIFLFSCLLLGVKIFLTTTIYHTSRNINTLQAQYDILLEEKQRLEKELEIVRSKYLITNLDD